MSLADTIPRPRYPLRTAAGALLAFVGLMFLAGFVAFLPPGCRP